MSTQKKSSIHKQVKPVPVEIEDPFVRIAQKYGLSTPQQVKDRVLWVHIKALIRTTYGDSKDIQEKLRVYEHEWSVSEQYENRFIMSANPDSDDLFK